MYIGGTQQYPVIEQPKKLTMQKYCKLTRLLKKLDRKGYKEFNGCSSVIIII